MSSTSSPTASEIRAPVEYSSSSRARLRSVSGPSASLSPPAPSSSASTSSRVRLLGSRRLGVGGLTAEATSSAVRPSAAAKRCSPRTAITARAADTADSGDGPGVGVAAAQRDEEVADVGLGDLGQVVDAAQRQVLGVAAQIAPVRAQGVGGDAAFDGQVVEVALQLVVRGPRPRRRRHQRSLLRGKAVGRSVHGASTGRSVRVRHRVSSQDARHRNRIHDLAAEDHADGLVERKPLHRQVGFLVVGVGPADVGQSGRQVDPHALVAETRRRDRDRRAPASRSRPGRPLPAVRGRR